MKNTVVVNLGWCVAKIEPDRPRPQRRLGAELRERAGQRAAGEGCSHAPHADREPLGRLAEPRRQRGGGQPEPAIRGVLDEFPDGLDEVGLEEYRDAKTTIARPDQVLSVLRETTIQEKVRREFGRPYRFQEKEILQPDMRWSKSSKGSADAGGIEKEIRGIGRPKLHGMRNDDPTKRSSHRFESGEQLPIEHHDVVRCLSRIMALEAWPASGVEYQEAIALLRLQRGIFEIKAGHVPETLSEIQEAWRSFDDETMEWLILRVSTGDPFCQERPGIPRVASGVKDRAARLKALGNAIVPQVAYQIFRAIGAADH